MIRDNEFISNENRFTLMLNDEEAQQLLELAEELELSIIDTVRKVMLRGLSEFGVKFTEEEEGEPDVYDYNYTLGWDDKDE